MVKAKPKKEKKKGSPRPKQFGPERTAEGLGTKATSSPQATATNGSTSYTAKDIYVLEGLEPVRKRPGMYIGSTGVDGPPHPVWGGFDNLNDQTLTPLS